MITANEIETGSIFLTTASMLFIAWYTFEAYRARKNSVLPVLVIILRRVHEHQASWMLRVKNIGNGPACSVRMKPIRNKTEEIKFNFSENYITPDGEEEVKFQIFDKNGNELTDEEKDFALFPIFEKDFHIRLIYKDIEGKTYVSDLKHLGDHKIFFKKFKKIFLNTGCL